MKTNKLFLLFGIGVFLVLLGCSSYWLLGTEDEKDQAKNKSPIDILKSETTDAKTLYQAVKKILDDLASYDRDSLAKQLVEIIKPENIDKYLEGSRALAAYLLGELRASDEECIKALVSMLLNPPVTATVDPLTYVYGCGGSGYNTVNVIRNGESIKQIYEGGHSHVRSVWALAQGSYKRALIKIGRPVVPEIIRILKENDAMIEIEVIENWTITYYADDSVRDDSVPEPSSKKIKKQVSNRVITDSLDILRSVLGGQQQTLELIDKLIKKEKDKAIKERLKKTKAVVEKWEEKQDKEK